MKDNYSEVFIDIVKNPKGSEDLKRQRLFKAFVHHVTCRGYDRLNDPDNIGGKFISKVPEYKNVSLEEAIQDSIDQLIDIQNGRKPCLLLSGGIDSTLAFYALCKTNKPFLVTSDHNLLFEYESLYYKLLSQEIPNVTFLRMQYDTLTLLSKSPDYLFVTGEIGDQIMGSMLTMKFNYEERNMTLKEAIKVNLLQRLDPEYPGDLTKDGIEYYHTTLDWLRKTEDTCTVAEFLWALNFLYKYLIVIYRLYSCDLIQYGPNKNTYHFFDTEKFQQYAMSHYKENCAYKEDYEYKQPFKDWIYAQNHDENYRKYKLKVPSLRVSYYYMTR